MAYIFAYLALAFSAATSNTRNLLVFWTLVLVLTVGFREWASCDFGNYLARFENHQNYTWTDVFYLDEPAFEALNHAVSSVGLDYMWLNALIAALLFWGLYSFAEKREHIRRGHCGRKLRFRGSKAGGNFVRP